MNYFNGEPYNQLKTITVRSLWLTEAPTCTHTTITCHAGTSKPSAPGEVPVGLGCDTGAAPGQVSTTPKGSLDKLKLK